MEFYKFQTCTLTGSFCNLAKLPVLILMLRIWEHISSSWPQSTHLGTIEQLSWRHLGPMLPQPQPLQHDYLFAAKLWTPS